MRIVKKFECIENKRFKASYNFRLSSKQIKPAKDKSIYFKILVYVIINMLFFFFTNKCSAIERFVRFVIAHNHI